LKKERIKRQKELEKQFENENMEITQPDPESEEYFKEIDRMFERREIRSYYISLICIAAMAILIVMSMFNNFRIDYNQYIHFAYYIIPFILLKTIQDGYEYFKKKYLKKNDPGDKPPEGSR